MTLTSYGAFVIFVSAFLAAGLAVAYVTYRAHPMDGWEAICLFAIAAAVGTIAAVLLWGL